MHRLAAFPLLASLIAAGSVSPAPAQTPAEGTCYAARPLPALPSGTRVFARPALVLYRDTASTPPAATERNAPTPLHLEAQLVTMQRATGTWVLTSGEPAKQTAAPAEKTPLIVFDTSDGHTTTIRTAVSVCAYPPGAPLPAYLAGVTPDVVIP